MYILSQSKERIVNFIGDDLSYLTILDGDSVVYKKKSGSTIYLGTYKTKEYAKFVLELIFREMEWGHQTYEMPQDDEVEED